ncbi:hypothetical protein [Pseudomonas sp. PDM30]|uniref:hypothetical protein n=1 Tax=Pseudomonas sp. PDM30 TaxID=2854773 RepID=UPI001C473940|nr:hypothetical protein [Pseudomonas sp. PDM30]MBV7489854.1 hypothetical protein [Pseudomonas sp. PDM30]
MQPIQFFAARAEDGALVPGATVDVFVSGTQARAALFLDSLGNTPLGNPFLADKNARVFFYTSTNRVDVHIHRGGYSAPLIRDIVITDPDDVLALTNGVYRTVAQGLAATVNGKIFQVVAPEDEAAYAIYQNVNGAAVDTGKRIPTRYLLDRVENSARQSADAAEAFSEASRTFAEGALAYAGRNFGPLAADPAANPLGQPLSAGDRYFNTTMGIERVFTGIVWLTPNADGQMIMSELGDATDPGKGGGMVAFMRGVFGRGAYTVAGMLSAQTLNVWEHVHVIPLADKIDPAEPATWYWDTAINAALQKGKKVLIPYPLKVKRKITTKVTGAQLVGDGIDSAGLVLDPLGGPGAGFIGDCVVELGDSTAAAEVSTHLGLSALTIDVGGRDIPGVAMFGARDGSYAKRVYIKNFSGTAFKTNKAGGGTGVATGKMCQGVKIEQVIALPQHGIKTDVFLLDGIFESEVNLCKAFGFTLAENSAVGFAVGRNTESRGVKLNTCAGANMVKFGNAANFNAVIQYGEWSRDNWDYNTTFENVEGAGVVFHGGTASGQLLPLNCRSIDPRPYFSAVAAVLNPLYLFRKANACFAEGVNYYSTVKAIFEFTGEGGLNNYGVLTGGVNPEALVSSGVVVFGAGTLSSNFVAGYSSEVSTRKEFVVTVDQQFYRVLPNGASEQTDQFYTTFNLGDSGKYRWRNKSLETVASIDDSSLSSGKTALSLKLIKNGVTSFDRIELGPTDSAGVGYRTLRIPN